MLITGAAWWRRAARGQTSPSQRVLCRPPIEIGAVICTELLVRRAGERSEAAKAFLPSNCAPPNLGYCWREIQLVRGPLIIARITAEMSIKRIAMHIRNRITHMIRRLAMTTIEASAENMIGNTMSSMDKQRDFSKRRSNYSFEAL